MRSLLQIAALLVAAAGVHASEYACPIPYTYFLNCSSQGLTTPPAGTWPQITRLSLDYNPIIEFPKNSLSGFPTLATLDMDNTPLTDLDFGDLATMPRLSSLTIQNNQIKTFSPPSDGQILENLQSISSNRNQISKLDPDFFLIAPKLYSLAINFNPLIVEAGQPVLNHPKLQTLYVGIGSDSFEVVDSSVFSGLPNLSWLALRQAKVKSVQGAFVNNKLLYRIDLSYNAITQITSGTFAPEGRITTLFLDGNPLTRLDTAAVNLPMASGGTLSIKNTPLACNCAFEALFWWASSRNITIDAECSGQDECSFTRRRSHIAPVKTRELTEAEAVGMYIPTY